MASPTAKLTFRFLLVAAVVLMLFYVGRPLYWKISATVHDIRHNKQTVSGGISQIVQEAQRSVGWYHDESDSGYSETKKSTSARRFLLGQASQSGMPMNDNMTVASEFVNDGKWSTYSCIPSSNGYATMA